MKQVNYLMIKVMSSHSRARIRIINKSNTRPLRNIQRRFHLQQSKIKQSEFFDPDLEDNSSRKRNRKKMMGLHFSEPGSHIKRAEMIRNKQLNKNEESKEAPPPPPPVEVKRDAKAELLRKIDQLKPLDPVPEVEHWDTIFLPVGAKQFQVEEPTKENNMAFKITENNFNFQKCTHFLHHPIPTKNPIV